MSEFSLIGANCNNANFSETKFVSADLRSANLTGAKLPLQKEKYYLADFEGAIGFKSKTMLSDKKYDFTGVVNSNNKIISVSLGGFKDIVDLYLHMAANSDQILTIFRKLAEELDKKNFPAALMDIKRVKKGGDFALILSNRPEVRKKIIMRQAYNPSTNFKGYFNLPFSVKELKYKPMLSSRTISFLSFNNLPLVITRSAGYVNFYDFAKYANFEEIKRLFYHGAYWFLTKKSEIGSTYGGSHNGGGSMQSVPHFHLRANNKKYW